jgi:WD40 repeat protein
MNGRVLVFASAALLTTVSLYAQYNHPEIVWSQRGHGDRTTAVRYSPDGQTIASGGTSLTGNAGSVVLWTAGGQLIREINVTEGVDVLTVHGIDFFDDGLTLVTAEGTLPGSGGSALKTAKSESTMHRPSRFISVPAGEGSNLRLIEGSSLLDVDISPDNTMIAYVQEFDTTAPVLDAGTGTVLKELPLTGEGSGAVKFSPNGQYLAVGDENGVVRVFRTSDWSIHREFANRDSIGGANWFALGISSLDWTADSTKVAVGVSGYGCGVRIWDVTTGERVQSIRLNYYFTGYVDYVPGDEYLAVGSTEWDYASQYNVLSPVNVRFINTVTGDVAARYDIPYSNPNDALMSFDVAPDGQTYVYGMSPGLVVVARNPYPPSGGGQLTAPAVTATATSASEVRVEWTTVQGAASYTVARSHDGGPFERIADVTTTSFTDRSVSADTTYLYKVAALAADAPYSKADAATTVDFAPSTLTTGTRISRAHIQQLRTAINAMRRSAGMAPATFTDATLTTATPVKAAHVQEIREHLDAARAALGLTSMSLSDPVLATGATRIKAMHVQELRNGCK